MEIITKAIVLKANDYKENDKLLTLLTLGNGKQKAILKGVKKATAKLKFAGMPFCFAEFELIKTKSMYVVKGAELVDMFYNLHKDYDKLFLAYAALEFLDTVCWEGENVDNLIVLLLNFLKSINYEDFSPKMSTVKFFLDALKLTGNPIILGGCANCGNDLVNYCYFDFQDGVFYCENCKKTECIKTSASLYKTICFLDSTAIERFNTLKVNDEQLLNVLKFIKFYIEKKYMQQLKSLDNLFNT